MPPAVIILTGAPSSESLAWDAEQLLDTFVKPISRFARLEGRVRSHDEDQDETQNVISLTSRPPGSASLVDHPSWRSLPLVPQYLHTGISQQHHIWDSKFQGASFLSLSDTGSFNSTGSPQTSDRSEGVTDDTRSQFYEHSFHTREIIPSSAIPSPTRETKSCYTNLSNLSSVAETTSFSITDTSFNSNMSSSVGTKVVPVAGDLTDLSSIPNAAYLTSIQPQTMTVNLIIGVISISEPRAIKTRRGESVELVELCVGDETRAGFEITFWLSDKPVRRQNPTGPTGGYDTRETLASLRAQDIVLVRNVALASFRGRVYGQSLRKDATKAFLLYRRRIDRNDVGGCYSSSNLDLEKLNDMNTQTLKAAKVKDWVDRFVGVRASTERLQQKAEVLPPDTQ